MGPLHGSSNARATHLEGGEEELSGGQLQEAHALRQVVEGRA